MTLQESWKMLGKIRYAEVHKIVEKMEGIPYVILKGEPLSVLCYGQEGERETSDVDFLIEKKNLVAFEKVLSEVGFQSIKQGEAKENRRNRILCLSNSHQIEPYRKMVFNLPIMVDVNFDVYWGEFAGERIPVQEFLRNTEETSIYGVKVQTLNLIYSLLQLVLHHYKEMNSLYHLTMHKVITRKRFEEIRLLYQELCRRKQVEEFLDICNQYGLKAYVYYLLYYANLLKSSKALQQGLELFKTDEGEALLETFGLDSKERKRWEIPFIERVDSDEVTEIVKRGLTKDDWEKLERSTIIFG